MPISDSSHPGGLSGGPPHGVGQARHHAGGRTSSRALHHDVGQTQDVVDDDDLGRDEEDAVG